MNVRLEPVTLDNWEEVINIDLEPEQWKNVEPPTVLHALCECLLRLPYGQPYAVRDGDQVVGFMSFGSDLSRNIDNAIHLLMIDKAHQRKGYGRAATAEAVRLMREASPPDRTAIILSYRKGNAIAAKLYQSFGFKPEGEDETDVIAILRWGEKLKTAGMGAVPVDVRTKAG